jgi:nitrate reductase delta subunit
MSRIFKALSLLLAYPTPEIAEAAPALLEAIRAERSLPAGIHAGLARLVGSLADADLMDAQERYVGLFDRSRSLSLHLFEHVHGESRDRGQAMADLQDVYEQHGMLVNARELPDYLPMFLEFLSTLPAGEARQMLGEPIHVIAALRRRLEKKDELDYAAVFAALEHLAEGEVDDEALQAVLAEPDDNPDDLQALDRIWEEEAVTFGPGAAGTVAPDGQCPSVRDILNRMAPSSEERHHG